MKQQNYTKFILNFTYKNKWSHLYALLMMMMGSFSIVIQSIYMRRIIDIAIPEKSIELLIFSLVIYILAISLQIILHHLANRKYIFMANNFVFKTRLDLLKNLYQKQGAYFCNNDPGDSLNKVYEDVSLVKRLITVSLFTLISDIIVAIPLIIFISSLDFNLLLVLAIIYPLIIFVQIKYNHLVYLAARKMKTSTARFVSVLQEIMSGITAIMISNKKDYALKEAETCGCSLNNDNIHLENTLLKKQTIMKFISTLCTVVLWGYGGYSVVYGDLSFGTLMIFISYSGKVFVPIQSLSTYITEYKKCIPSFDRIYSVLDDSQNINYGKLNITSSPIALEFADVKFSYTDELVLSNINFCISDNGITSIIGESGSGKSTIVKLIAKLWTVNDGKILVNGNDLNSYSLEGLRSDICIVPQTSFLFNKTIKENLVLSKNNMTEQDIIQALQLVDIYDFICKLPRGMNTQVGDNGLMLSGGQRQRIALAQALLQGAKLLILDEALSALDNVSSINVLEGIRTTYSTLQIINITHNMELVKYSKKIIVIKNGKICDTGTHDELIKISNEYTRLYKL